MTFSHLFLILQLFSCLFILIRGAVIHKNPCSSTQGYLEPHFLGNGFTCCNNMYLEHPIQPKNEHWRKCLSKQHGNSDDDLPKTMWQAYLCELSSAGFLTANQPTYKDYEAFFTRNYPKDVQDRLISKNVTCEVPVSTDIVGTVTNIKKFEECFFKAERQMCLNMAGATHDDHAVAAEEMACEEVETLKDPNNSFIAFAQPCCKGQEIPYVLFDLFMDFDRFEIANDVVTCVNRLKDRVNELSPQSPDPQELKLCQVACVHEADGFGGKYDSKFQDLLNFKLKSVSNSVRTIMREKIAKYNPQFKLWKSNQTVPMDQAGDIISSLDEVSQIINYCKFHFEATAEAYRALYEYCYNEQYGIQFREDILHTPNEIH